MQASHSFEFNISYWIFKLFIFWIWSESRSVFSQGWIQIRPKTWRIHNSAIYLIYPSIFLAKSHTHTHKYEGLNAKCYKCFWLKRESIRWHLFYSFALCFLSNLSTLYKYTYIYINLLIRWNKDQPVMSNTNFWYKDQRVMSDILPTLFFCIKINPYVWRSSTFKVFFLLYMLFWSFIIRRSTNL